MKFLFDENMPTEIARKLMVKDHNIIFAKKGLPDREIAKIAKTQKRIIVTQDKDFADILQYPPREFTGIIRLRIHPPLIEKMLAELENVLTSLKPDDIVGHLIVIDEDGFRIR